MQKDLAEIFLGGFMHDCALWSAETAPGESHETAGARLLWNIPEIHQFLPSLTTILLFHSDVIRIAAKPALVQIVEHPDDPARTSFRAEFYRSAMTPVLRFASVATTCAPRSLARAACTRCCRWPSPSTASPRQRDSTRAPYPKIVSRLAGQAQAGLYLRYIVALCNAQIEVIALRGAQRPPPLWRLAC